MPTPCRNRRSLRFADDLHRGLPRIGESGRCIRRLLERVCGLGYVADDRLPTLTDRHVLYGDLLFAPGPVALKRLHLGREGPRKLVKRAFGTVLMW